MKDITENSKALGQLASITHNGTQYETDTLTKAGAFLGLQVGIGGYLGNRLVCIALRNHGFFCKQSIRPLMQRTPVVIPAAVLVGAALGGVAQSFESYTGRTTISDCIIDNVVYGKNTSSFEVEF